MKQSRSFRAVALCVLGLSLGNCTCITPGSDGETTSSSSSGGSSASVAVQSSSRRASSSATASSGGTSASDSVGASSDPQASSASPGSSEAGSGSSAGNASSAPEASSGTGAGSSSETGSSGAADAGAQDSGPRVNVVPVITGQGVITLQEDTSRTLLVTDLVVTDPDNTFPDDFVLMVGGGPNHTVAGAVITPAANFAGNLDVPVMVSDGTDVSALFSLRVVVLPVNDAPVITAQQPLSVASGGSLDVTLGDVTLQDPDSLYPDAFSLAALPGDNHTITASPPGFTVQVNAGFTGMLELGITANDGADTSAVFLLRISVPAGGVTPIITGQQNVTTPEDTPVTLTVADLQATDAPVPPSVVKVLDGAGYTRLGNQILPDQDFVGDLTVPVRVFNGTLDSAVFNLVVQVTAVNDAPVVLGQDTLQTPEDTPRVLTLGDLDVVDVDDAAGDLTLTLNAGPNYTVQGGNAVVPDLNFHGDLQVSVTVSDGDAAADATVRVVVLPVNDAPVIVGQRGVGAVPGTPRTVLLSDLVVQDPDNTLPSDFSITLQDGPGYTHSAGAFRLNAGATGTVAVTVVVNDGSASSAPFSLQVTVLSAPNNAPVITGQRALALAEDGTLALQVSDLTVVDSDGPSAPTLLLENGPNHTVAPGNVLVPNANFSGMLQVVVRANDGVDSSAPFTVVVTVTEVPDAPVIESTPTYTTAEDTPFTVALADFGVTDVDTPAAQRSVTVQDGANYAHVGNVVTPAQDFHGTLTVGVRVDDGSSAGTAALVSVTVTPVNDVPVITLDAVPDTPEDTPLELTAAMFMVDDPDGPTLTLVVSGGPNHTVVGTTVVPAPNYNGPLTVSVAPSDGVGTGPAFSVLLLVTAVGDAPVITAQAPLSTLEDTPLLLTLADLSVTDPDSSYPADFSLTVLPGTNHAGSSGTTVRPDADFAGTLTVNVRVNDGSLDSAVFPVTVTVTAQNDAPVVTAQAPLTVDEDDALTLTLADFTVVDVDGPSLELLLATPGAGSRYTVSGTQVIPDPDFAGPLSVVVRVTDGVATSADFVAQVTVTPQNDAPIITAQLPAVLTTSEDTPVAVTLANLTVTDVDDAYPNGFALVLQAGPNHTIGGGNVVPAANFNGMLSVPVAVRDAGGATSAVFALAISVTSVNDAPVITGQNPSTLPLTEDTPFDVTLSNLLVTDVDHTYPTGFTLVLETPGPAANYTVSGTTVTPAPNYNGPLSVLVRVVDPLGASSAVASLVANVASQNDAPIITGQAAAVSTAEDTPVTLTLATLTVTDADHTYPGTFTLTATAGTNFTLGTVTGTTAQVVPAPNFNGTLSVPVTVTDPSGSASNTFNVQVQVTAVNDAPTITAQAVLSTPEDTALVLALGNFTVTDVDHPGYPSGFTLVLGSGANYAVSGTTVTPSANYNGTLTVPVTVRDPANASSATFNATVTVTSVNDLPAITAQTPSPLAATEDTAFTITTSNLVVTDADHTYPTSFTVQVGTGTNYAVSGATVTPAANFAGTLSIPVTVTDPAGGVSASFTVQANVAAVNDPPVITAQATLSTPEETALSLALAQFTATDVDHAGYPSGFTLQVGTGANYTVSGTTVTPALNFNGTLTVPVTVRDPANAASAVFNASITVTAVNDLPVITAQAALTTAEDVPITLLLGNLTVTDVDNAGYPSGFTLQVGAGSNYAASGAVVTPAANFSGTLSIPVTVTDPAGGTSATFNASVTVTPVNDPPVITSTTTPASIQEDTPFTLVAGNLTVTDPDDTYPAGHTLVLSNCVNCTIAGLVVTPTLNFFSGAAMTVDVVVNDGDANSNTRTLSFSVTAVNDNPVAAADAATTNGNTLKTVGAPGLLANDTDVDSTGLTVTPGTVTSSNMGTAVLAADGSYTFLPRAGFTGTDTFNYTLNDPQGGTATGTVTITVVNLVWYVSASAASGGTGRSTQPFQTLAAAQAASSAGSAMVPTTIYVRTGTYSTGITLKALQRLHGEGILLDLSPHNPSLPAGTRPTINPASGAAVTVASNNTLLGFNVGSAPGAGVSGTGALGAITIQDVDLASTRNGVALAASDATSSVALTRVNVNTVLSGGLGTGAGLKLSRLQMTVNTVTVTAASLTGLEVLESRGASTFNNLTLSNNGQDGIFWQSTSVSNGATATFDALTVDGTNDPGSAILLRSDGTSGAVNVRFTFQTPRVLNVRGFGDGLNAATEGNNASMTLEVAGGELVGGTSAVPSGDNGIRVNAASLGGTLNLTVDTNTLFAWGGDAVSLEAGSFSALNAEVLGNTVGSASNASVIGGNGDGIAFLLDAPVTGTGASQGFVTLTANVVSNVLGRAYEVRSRGGVSGQQARAKAVFSRNRAINMTRSAARPSLEVESNGITQMCSSFAADDMVLPVGGAQASLIRQLGVSQHYRNTVPGGGTVTLSGTFGSPCPY